MPRDWYATLQTGHVKLEVDLMIYSVASESRRVCDKVCDIAYWAIFGRNRTGGSFHPAVAGIRVKTPAYEQMPIKTPQLRMTAIVT